MKTIDAFKSAIRGLKQNLTRSLLTMLGIVIGISSVILLMSIGASAQKLILNQVESTGSNLVFIVPGGTHGSRFASPASVQGIIIKTLVKEDVDSLRREPTVVRISPEARGQARVVFENNDISTTYLGVTEDYSAIRNFNVVDGQFFTKSDVDSYNKVAVLGSEITKKLFGEINPIGKIVRVKNISFRVIGVLEEKGLGPFGVDQDNLVIMPLALAQKNLLGIDFYNSVVLQANDSYNIEFTKERIISILRQNHHITDPEKDDFTIRSQEDALSILGNITDILKLFLTAIAFISLVVGGIGIMNIMLVSVVERTKEIGLRKAVGAADTDILKQFLFEAIILTSAGGFVGIFIGSGMTVVLYFILKNILPTGWVFQLPPSAILLAVSVAVLTGIVFGVYPARQAARKNPIEALRYE